MSDNKVSLILFNIGFVLMLISMATGPFNITNWSLASGGAACLFALASIYLSFPNLNFKPPVDAKHNEESINAAGKGGGASDAASNR